MTPIFGPPSWRSEGSRASTERSWLDSWLDATTWWIKPTTRASVQAFAYGPERILVEVVDGLAQRFGGGPVECSVRGRSVVAHLDWVRLVRRKDRYEAHLQLSHAALDGFPVDRLSAVAQSLQITSGRQPRLTLRDIEVKGRSALSPVVGWLSTRLTEWFFSIDDAGAIIARHRRRRVALEIEPSVAHDRLQLELRALRWRHRRLPVPAWLRLKRTTTLQLQPGVSVVDARRRGQEVDFELRVESVDQGIRLPQLRNAIRQGGPVPLP